MSPPFQLVRSPECAGTSVADALTAVCRFQPPLNDSDTLCPEFDDGGVAFSTPNTEPLSWNRLLGIDPTTVGICARPSNPTRRAAESAEMPLAWRPTASVLSSVCRSFATRPSW